MKVIVDTSVWSLALRRNEPQNSQYVKELEELIKEVRAQLIGPVRQELLNGIKQHWMTLKTQKDIFQKLSN